MDLVLHRRPARVPSLVRLYLIILVPSTWSVLWSSPPPLPERSPNTSFGLIIWDCREGINWESGWVRGTFTSGRAALSSHAPAVFSKRHGLLSPKKTDLVPSPRVCAVRDPCFIASAAGVRSQKVPDAPEGPERQPDTSESSKQSWPDCWHLLIDWRTLGTKLDHGNSMVSLENVQVLYYVQRAVLG